MELPEVGEHCALADCSKLDFLPFKCVHCASIFCADHRRPQDHRCVKAEAAEAERAEAEAERRTSAAENGGNVSFSCSFVKAGCKQRELTAVVCPKCGLTFCLSHRHPPDHDCAVYQEEERLKREKQKSTLTPSAARLNQRPLRGAKARQTAAKVALMKMKLHAVGDKAIPQTERVYFWLALPRKDFQSVEGGIGGGGGGGAAAEQPSSVVDPSKPKDSPMFFCSKWSLGRAIDFAASHMRLRNANNVAVAPKLRLFRHEDGAPLRDLGKTWQEVVDENVVFSGSPLVLEYVDPNEDGNVNIDPKLYPL